MSTFFMVYYFFFFGQYMYDDMMASCRRISLACSLSAFFTVYHFTFLDILCRNFRIVQSTYSTNMLFVYIFHGILFIFLIQNICKNI